MRVPHTINFSIQRLKINVVVPSISV